MHRVTNIDIERAIRGWMEEAHNNLMAELFGDGDGPSVGARVPTPDPTLPGNMALEVPV